jgi:hypothetical protein
VHVTAVVVCVVVIGSLFIMALPTADAAARDTALRWNTDDYLTPTAFDAWVDGVTTALLRASATPTNNMHRLITAPLSEAPSSEDKYLASRLYAHLMLYCRGGRMLTILITYRGSRRGDLAWRDIIAYYEARVAAARIRHAKQFRDLPNQRHVPRTVV